VKAFFLTSNLVFQFTFQTSLVLRITNLEEKKKRKRHKVRNKSMCFCILMPMQSTVNFLFMLYRRIEEEM
jgi:hypothetical protein